MLLLPYFYERQIGSVRKTKSTFTRPDLDFLLSRLVCGVNDVFITRGEDGIPVPPFTCKYRKDKESDLLAVANEDGEVYLIDTDKGKGVIKNFTAHNNAVFDICWLPDKNSLLTGSGDFRCCLFDMYTCKKVSTFRYHTASIKSVDVLQDGRGTTLAAGSKDGSISIWDIREDGLHSKPAIVINQAHERTLYHPNKRVHLNAHTSSSVSAVTFRDGNTLASAGVGDSVIKIWDLRKTYDKSNLSCRRKPRESVTFSDNKVQGFGYTSLVFNSLYTKLYACSTANKIFEIDCHSYTKKYERFTGLKSSTYFVKMSLSHDDQYIASGSSDNKAYIWKTSKPGLPLFELAGHTAEVTSVAWGAYNNTKLATCGDDHKVLLWKTKYSDHTAENPDNEQVAASRPYSSGITNDSSDTISIFLPVTPIIHTKKSPNFKSPSTSKSIRSYFSPLPPNPVSLPQLTQSKSNLKIDSTKSQSSQSPSNLKNDSTKPQSSQSPSNLKNDSTKPQSSGGQRNPEGESSYAYPTIFSGGLSASASSPPQSAKPQTICSPGTASGKLSSVSVTQSGNGSEDTAKENMQQQSIQNNSNGESTSDPQPSHTSKRGSTSINDSPLSNYSPTGKSTSAPHSTNSPNSETAKTQSSQSETKPNKASTSSTPNSNSTQSSHRLSNSTTESASIPHSSKSPNSDSTQSSHSPNNTTRESASIPHSSNNPNRDSRQSSHSPSNTTTQSTSSPHSSNSPNSDSTPPQSCNSLSSSNREFPLVPHSTNSPSEHSSGSPSNTTIESTSVSSPHSRNSPNSNSTQPQSCNSLSSLNRESALVPHSTNNHSTQSSGNPSNTTKESTSFPHSSNSPNSESNTRQSCNSLSTPVVQREPLSPRKNIHGASVVKGSGFGKENGSGVKKSNGQTKRKLDVNDRACKHHLDGCRKTRGKTRCGKRIVSCVVPEKNNLTDYFSVIQTPDKHQNSAL